MATRPALRICHLGKFYPPARGGFETHLQTLVQAQSRLGAQVTVLCVNHQDRSGRDVTWDNLATTPTVEDHDGPVRVVRLGRVASVARLDICPALPGRLNGHLARNFDLLHLHVPNPTMLLALAAARPRLPLVVTYQSDVIKQRILAFAVLPFERMVFGQARVLLSSSPTYIDGSAHLRHYRPKVGVLPMGINLQPYLRASPAARAFQRQLLERHGQPLWLSVGRLVYYKGLRNAIRALPQVPGKLLIVGTGPLRQELETEARSLGVADRVVWCGNLGDDEIVGAYHAATALWFPSNARSEGYGLVQLEAMACGCPVINTAIPHSGVAWVSRHEVSGLTVPVDDPAALAAAALRLCNEPGLRERLARQAVERCRTEFSDTLMGRRSLDVYRAVLQGRSVPTVAL